MPFLQCLIILFGRLLHGAMILKLAIFHFCLACKATTNFGSSSRDTPARLRESVCRSFIARTQDTIRGGSSSCLMFPSLKFSIAAVQSFASAKFGVSIVMVAALFNSSYYNVLVARYLTYLTRFLMSLMSKNLEPETNSKRGGKLACSCKSATSTSGMFADKFHSPPSHVAQSHPANYCIRSIAHH